MYSQKRNFSWIQQKMKQFPIDPHYKNGGLDPHYINGVAYRHDGAKVGEFLQWGSMGKFYIFCRIKLKFSF